MRSANLHNLRRERGCITGPQPVHGVLWYSHSNNPHAGGGAAMQSYADFLANGPRFSTLPEEMIRSLYAAVKLLAQG